MKRVILIHGWDGHPGDHWKKWFKGTLIGKGIRVIEPQLSGGSQPELEVWNKEIAEAIGTPDMDTCVVGHSLGCIALVHYLRSLKDSEKIAGAVFVAGFSSDIGMRDDAESFIEKFYLTPEEVGKAKKHCDKFVTIVSDNDSAVPLAKALEFQKELDAELILEEGKGHFCEEDGVMRLQSALDSVLKILE
ncbi:MAG: alpha/beta hydrolase [Candidatus Taylorbacteria bacterium]|nr:alpha/beta hydrolase [Candidatus Taylorbacteria bacterium]